MSRILNIKNTKEFALRVSKEKRLGRFTRISQDALDRWEARLKLIINDEVYKHPSKGVTIK
jgi:hypothetical protein